MCELLTYLELCFQSHSSYVFQEYQKLKKEVEGLRALVELNKAGEKIYGQAHEIGMGLHGSFLVNNF